MGNFILGSLFLLMFGTLILGVCASAWFFLYVVWKNRARISEKMVKMWFDDPPDPPYGRYR